MEILMRKRKEFEVMNNDKVEEKGAEDEEQEEEVHVEADAGDMRDMRKMHDPKLPTKAEKEAHDMTHLPFRSWCRHCVRGRWSRRGAQERRAARRRRSSRGAS